jgi:YHS domain-containing protein
VTDPEFALFHLQRAMWDPVDPERVGSLDPELKARVNGEWYRFADRADLERFRRRPALYCGLLRDPVSGLRFRPTPRSPRVDWDGSPWFFAADSTRALFEREPKRWEVKRPG